MSAYFREQKVKWLKYIAYFRGESLSGGKYTHTHIYQYSYVCDTTKISTNIYWYSWMTTYICKYNFHIHLNGLLILCMCIHIKCVFLDWLYMYVCRCILESFTANELDIYQRLTLFHLNDFTPPTLFGGRRKTTGKNLEVHKI